LRLGQRLYVGAAGLIGACLRCGHSLIAAALRPCCAPAGARRDDQRSDDENRDRARLQVPGRRSARRSSLVGVRPVRHGPPPVGPRRCRRHRSNFRRWWEVSSRARPRGECPFGPRPALSGSRSTRIVSRSVPVARTMNPFTRRPIRSGGPGVVVGSTVAVPRRTAARSSHAPRIGFRLRT
jgi:hypothetical protein